jgi:hypothetical protein
MDDMQPVMAVFLDGTKEWTMNDKIHRTDGPAVVYTCGDKEWWVDDEVHRTDGPAIEYANGDEAWWLNNERFTFDEWLDEVDMSNEDKVMMKLQYG